MKVKHKHVIKLASRILFFTVFFPAIDTVYKADYAF